MTLEEQIIWLAGLLEGEGYFTAENDKRRNNNRHCLRVKLDMIDKDVVCKASEIFYSKSSIREYTQKRDNCQIVYRYVWSGNDAEALMRAILPFMGERRSTKIQECLSAPNLSHRKAET